MSGEPQFQRVTGTNLFWMSASAQTIGFQASPDSGLDDNSLLSETWADEGGIYLFLSTAPSNAGDFAASLRFYLGAQARGNGLRFLWLENPNDPYTYWLGHVLMLTSTQDGWHVKQGADFPFQNYVLRVTGGSSVALAAQAQDWGFAFTGASAASLYAPGGIYRASGNLLLPLAGPTTGCWRFALDLPAATEPESDFTRLGVGVRYFYPDGAERGPAAPGEPATAEDGFVRAINLPAILQAAARLSLYASLDVLRPLVPDRTYLSFYPPGGGSGPGPLDSTFATATGHPVRLAPLAAAGGLPDARLVFAVQPMFTGRDNLVPVEYYLTPQGAFDLNWTSQPPAIADATGQAIYRLLCGTSGLEYLGLPADTPNQLLFVPGGAAYSDLQPVEKTDTPSLTPLGTTAWVYVQPTPGKAVKYYAQPEKSPLYEAPQTTTSATFLDFLEVPALTLAANDGQSFPVAPYHGLAEQDVPGALALEARAIAPARHQALRQIHSAAWAAPSEDLSALAATATTRIGVTPQGLAVGLGEDYDTWTWLGIASDHAGVASAPNLRFTAVAGAFRQALQTNRLFMVLANDDVFSANGTVSYRLTAAGIAEIDAAGAMPVEVRDKVRIAFQNLGYPVFDTEQAFVAALLKAVPGAEPYKLDFERQAGLLAPVIAGWRFQMSPRNWYNPNRLNNQHALTVFKFADGRSLRQFTEDLSTWTWPEVAAFTGGAAADAQRELLAIFADAEEANNRASGGRQSPYADLVRLLDDEHWSGIITFNCEVPLSGLPEPLQALAAGIDANRFYAHHVGFNRTPFDLQNGALVFGQSSMFGLIDYQDPEDQAFGSNISYAFKVLRLTVGFRNSAVTSFSSQIELLVNRLFGAPTRLYPDENGSQHGNNIILDGVYQRQRTGNQEQGTYVFSTTQQNVFQLENVALRRVILNSMQLVMTTAAKADDPTSEVTATFLLGGDMQFYEAEGFDLFSFGESSTPQLLKLAAPATATTAGPPPSGPEDSRLRFGNLGIVMKFTMAERKPSFSLLTETLSFDMSNSKARPDSLFAGFPLQLSGFVATPDVQLQPDPAKAATSGQKPADLGYIAIGAPVQQSTLSQPWYGLVYNVDLGTLGALAGSAGLTLKLLIGWSGGGTRDEPAIYLGVRLPGVKDALGVELPLQGVLTLGFRSIQFLTYVEGGRRHYVLRFRNFVLRFLGLSFPPGHNDIYLFGNPNQQSNTKLGWYAAYSSDKDEKKKKTQSSGSRLLTARRVSAIQQLAVDNEHKQGEGE